MNQTPDPREQTGRPGVPDHTVWQLGPKRAAVALLIPVIDEGDRLRRQLTRLQRSSAPVDIIIADGGSADGSTNPLVLAQLGVRTLLVKRGPGRLSAQLRMGFAHCMDEGYDAVVTMDGNDKDGEDGLARIVAALRDGADFVQGSRFIDGGVAENTPLTRYVAIRALHAPLTSLAARHRYTDTTNGFRGHSRSLVCSPEMELLRDVFDSYELLAYIPIRAARLGMRCIEVPVSRRYPPGKPPTKIHRWSGSASLVKILISAARGRFDPDAAVET